VISRPRRGIEHERQQDPAGLPTLYLHSCFLDIASCITCVFCQLLIHHPGSTAYRCFTGKYNLEAKSRVYRLRKDIDCRMQNQNQDPGLRIRDQGSRIKIQDPGSRIKDQRPSAYRAVPVIWSEDPLRRKGRTCCYTFLDMSPLENGERRRASRIAVFDLMARRQIPLICSDVQA
jgi:hypothetical protein